MPTLPKKAVFMNLYSSNCENSAAAAAVREYHHLKKQIRGPMSERALKDMMDSKAFFLEEDEKRVNTANVEDIATSVVEANSESLNIQAVQQLKPHDLDTRKTFTLDFLARSVVHDSWPWNIMWMEKALFPLNRQVNSYNCRIWVTENSHAIHTKALHDTGCDRTERYREMLQTYVNPNLQQRGYLQEIIFMHDRAPPHIASSVQQLLRQAFTNACVISRFSPTTWHLRSPDLTH
ncbi:UNVERIFIED_CONTAM: hypothetical protein NCL1_27708 [Trichonephila clavipes]